MLACGLFVRDLTCSRETSAARRMSTADFRVRLASRSRRSFNAWFLIPQITRSRFRPSFRFSNSHVEARVRNTVTYCRVDGFVFCLIANIKFVSLVCHVFLRATILSECFSQLLSRSFPYWPSVFARLGFRFRKC